MSRLLNATLLDSDKIYQRVKHLAVRKCRCGSATVGPSFKKFFEAVFFDDRKSLKRSEKIFLTLVLFDRLIAKPILWLEVCHL